MWRTISRSVATESISTISFVVSGNSLDPLVRASSLLPGPSRREHRVQHDASRTISVPPRFSRSSTETVGTFSFSSTVTNDARAEGCSPGFCASTLYDIHTRENRAHQWKLHDGSPRYGREQAGKRIDNISFYQVGAWMPI